MYIPFEEMPNTARVWVYQSTRKFSPQDKELVISKLSQFCRNWNTHGNSMPSSFDIQYDQIIILSVDESNLGASGCSIDSSVRTLREIEQQLDVNLLDQGKVSFIEQGKVITGKFQEIREFINSGDLREDSPVFNPMVHKKEDLGENWLIPAKESWLNKYFAH